MVEKLMEKLECGQEEGFLYTLFEVKTSLIAVTIDSPTDAKQPCSRSLAALEATKENWKLLSRGCISICTTWSTDDT